MRSLLGTLRDPASRANDDDACARSRVSPTSRPWSPSARQPASSRRTTSSSPARCGAAPSGSAWAWPSTGVVQEALANVAGTRRPVAPRVVLRVGGRHRCPYAEVEVLDDGRPRGATSGSGLGHLGMRERAAGHAAARSRSGPAPTGGYRVRVRVPLEADACLTPTPVLRVLIVDDQHLVRSGFRDDAVRRARPRGGRRGRRRAAAGLEQAARCARTSC